MKILVVDDELVSRMKMKKILESLGECTEVESGQQALAEFYGAWEKGERYDLITLDIYMPEMDGTQVLHQIREFEKSSNVPKEMSVRIFMVTAHSDKETIIACIKNGCNDYIMKPFSKETVMKKLSVNNNQETQRGENSQPQDSKQPMLNYIIEQFKRGEIDLPPLSKIYTKFNELLKNNPQFQEIAELLKQDPAISAKLISISNSAYYRGAVENESLEQAIGRLGMQTTKQTVDTISQKSLYISSNEKYSGIIDMLWEHSLSTAHAGLLITESLNKKSAKDIFSIGLFHDIGKLFLLQVLAEIEKKEPSADSPSKEELEEWIEIHHCRAGSTLLTKWGFPAEIAQVALNHENTEASTYELLIVHAANEIVKSMGYSYPSGKKAEPLGSDIMQRLGLTPEMLEEIQGQVRTRVEQIKEFLG